MKVNLKKVSNLQSDYHISKSDLFDNAYYAEINNPSIKYDDWIKENGEDTTTASSSSFKDSISTSAAFNSSNENLKLSIEPRDLLEVPAFYTIGFLTSADGEFRGQLERKIINYYNFDFDGEFDWEFETNTGVNFEPTFVVSRNAIAIVAKEFCSSRLTLTNLEASLYEVKDFLEMSDIHYLALPKLGCGRNGLNWDDVLDTIISVFSDVEDSLNILICDI